MVMVDMPPMESKERNGYCNRLFYELTWSRRQLWMAFTALNMIYIGRITPQARKSNSCHIMEQIVSVRRMTLSGSPCARVWLGIHFLVTFQKCQELGYLTKNKGREQSTVSLNITGRTCLKTRRNMNCGQNARRCQNANIRSSRQTDIFQVDCTIGTKRAQTGQV